MIHLLSDIDIFRIIAKLLNVNSRPIGGQTHDILIVTPVF